MSKNRRSASEKSYDDDEEEDYESESSHSERKDDRSSFRSGTSRSETVASNLRPSANKGLDSYHFAKDFLPKRYDRHTQSDIPLKIIAFTQLGINIFIGVFFIQTELPYVMPFTWFGGLHFGFMCFFFILTQFWLNYKLNHFFLAVYRLFMDLDVIKRNDKYYSGLEIPDFFIQSKIYPTITIQIPVYKENLENTIRPTLLHCRREADRYKEETGARCNIIVCDDGYNVMTEEERTARFQFYEEYDIAFTARPHPSKLTRHGRFKKAGNLNFSMNFAETMRLAELAEEDEDYLEHAQRRDEWLAMGAEYNGDIEYGDYILLVDSDTRLPLAAEHENGCLKKLAKEMMFDGHDVLFIQCFTGPYMSVKSGAEKGVFHHTCNVYNSILMSTAIHSMAPLVGHNAILNKKGLGECARMDEKTNYAHYWAEDKISEDFDLMMRGYERGYTGRFASHAGVFLEGVSFSYMTEYFKISKFGCGAAEMIYNPVTLWCKEGAISENLRGFVKSKQVEWYNKMFIIAYILNYLALAIAHWGLLYNLIFCEYIVRVVPPILWPVNLMWEAIFVWTFAGGIFNYLFGLRLGFEKKLLLKQVIRESIFLTCLYGSLSVKMSIICMSHLFNWSLSFGATLKDDTKVTMMDWIKSTPMETTIYTFYLAAIVVRVMFFSGPGKYFFVIYNGCTPLLYNIILFWAGPLIFDVLPRRSDKTTQDTYNEDDKMFTDKYGTQIPNSKLVQAIKVGSNVKMAAPNMRKGPRNTSRTDDRYSDEDSYYSDDDDSRSYDSDESDSYYDDERGGSHRKGSRRGGGGGRRNDDRYSDEGSEYSDEYSDEEYSRDSKSRNNKRDSSQRSQRDSQRDSRRR